MSNQPVYRVTVDGDFLVSARDKRTVTNRLERVFRQEGFEDVSFEIGIEKHRQEKPNG